MISAAASFFADVVAPLVSFIVESCFHILVASARPWRYLFSSRFRSELNSQFAQRHPLLKLWYLIWGSFLLMASVAVIAGLVWFFAQLVHQPEPDRDGNRPTIEKLEQAIAAKIKEEREKQ